MLKTQVEQLKDAVYYNLGGKKLVEFLGLERDIFQSYYTALNFFSDDKKRVAIEDIEKDFLVTTPAMTEQLLNFQSEQEVLVDIIRHATKDDVIYDVGASVGLYTCFLSDVSPSVYAFEPYPPNYDVLQENLSLNGDSGVKTYEIALSSEEGTAELFLEDDQRGTQRHSLAQKMTDREDADWYKGGGQKIDVSTESIDSFVDNRQEKPPSILKIDVEGAEMDVLKGADRTVDEHNPKRIYVEIHGDTEQDVRNWGRERDYAIETINTRHGQDTLRLRNAG